MPKPFICLTSSVDQDIEEIREKYGIDRVVGKPIKMTELAKILIDAKIVTGETSMFFRYK